MKKVILGLISMFLLFGLVGCGDSGETQTTQAKQKLPTISQDSINTAQKEMNKYKEVSDSYIEVKDNTITFCISIKDASMREEKAKDLADSFVRLLSSQVSYSNKQITGPNGKDNLGEIYDYYDISVGIGTNSDNIMYQGAKVSGAKKITW